jgi:hypothetical protein
MTLCKVILPILVFSIFSALQANAFDINAVNNDLCNTEFSAELWDRVAAPLSPAEHLTELKTEKGLAYLLRFQKPGGFDPKLHLSIVESSIRSDLLKKHPDLVLGMLQTILYESVPLYHSILTNHPELLKIKGSNNDNIHLCRTEKEAARIKQKVLDYLEHLVHIKRNASRLQDWDSLIPLSPILSSFTNDERKRFFKKIYRSIASGAQLHPDGRGIFYSKLQKFTKQPIRKLFGKQRKRFTDLSFKKSQDGTVIPIILATEPIDGHNLTETDFGFYKKTLPGISTNNFYSRFGAQQISVLDSSSNQQRRINIYQQRVNWMHDGKEFNGTIRIRRKDGFDYLPKGKDPHYQGLWKDGRLTGMVVISNNFSKKSSTKLINNYIGYYKEAGFEFSPFIQVKDTLAFLKKKISSGEVDYLIKETHSQGDEKNLFRIQEASNVIEGSRKAKDGKGERIYLIYPSPPKGRSQRLSPQAMGLWIKERSLSGGDQLLYISSSCYSEYKASNEIAAVASPLFVDIPASSNTIVFTNTKEDAKRIILDGIRGRQTYEEMRIRLHQTPRYKQFRDNDFIFPDDRRYTHKFASSGAHIIDVQIDIEDAHGKPYHLDEQVSSY